MDTILLSWDDLETLKLLQASLISINAPAAIVNNTKTNGHLLLVNKNDKMKVAQYINTQVQSLQLPTELIEQVNTRHGL